MTSLTNSGQFETLQPASQTDKIAGIVRYSPPVSWHVRLQRRRAKTLLHGGNFVEKTWKENFRPSSRTFECIVQVSDADLAYLFATKTNVENATTWDWLDTMRYEISWDPRWTWFICHHNLGYRNKPWLITGLVEFLRWLTFCCLGWSWKFSTQ